MARCPHCDHDHSALPAPPAFCPSCGGSLDDDSTSTPTVATPTVAVPPPRPASENAARTPAPHSTPPGVSPHTPPGQRFAPGQVLGDRFRIVSLLGRGGMGEVYRAEDLRLEETVALKFLPRELGADESARARLREEVRVTRQVSHGNVCRVHDLAEVSGEVCIAMEFIDGEDLASLLRRIGRLPPDKGVEIARQLCSGLSAAHARGVLHRDLKPANVMLDGVGRVKINDFGIAALVGAADGHGFAGTPLYMAPEVLEGAPATIASDIYAIGLILHELFTGRRVIEGRSIAEVRRWHAEGGHVSLSTSETLDPTVAAAIERCLDPDPTLRPTSAAAVAALLPGGDPLLAALAAGETPSPELVAAAGGVGCVSRRAGGVLLIAVIVAFSLMVWLDQRARIANLAPPAFQPAALEYVASKMLTAFGVPEEKRFERHGFAPRKSLIDFVEREDISPDRWERVLGPGSGAMQFWLRTSPRPLTEQRGQDGRVSGDDPPLELPGMTRLRLCARSKRLLEFRRILGPEIEVDAARLAPSPEPPWSAVLEAAELEPVSVEETEPRRIPDQPFDARRAWRGRIDGIPDVSVVVEAAAWQGRIVAVHVNDRWPVLEARGDAPLPDAWRPPGTEDFLGQVIFVLCLFAGAWFGIGNVRAGRSDRAGADRLAIVIIVSLLVAWALRAHHALGGLGDERILLVRAISHALFLAAFAWILHLAIEPTLRRAWPQKLVSWTRMFRARRIRDPLVARDLLVGIACGVSMSLIARAHWQLGARFTGVPPAPLHPEKDLIASFRHELGHMIWIVPDAVFIALICTFIVVLALIVTRSRGLAYATMFAIAFLGLPYPTTTESAALDIAMRLLVAGTFLVALHRSLLALFGAMVIYNLLEGMAVTLDPQSWLFPQGLWVVAVVIGSATFLARRACASSRPAAPLGARADHSSPSMSGENDL